MIKKGVIPAAGLGTRLLFATKEQPKEMLPIFTRSVNGHLRLKPLLQVIFEELYDTGFRELCFIVGRGKRVVEDFFTPDDAFVEYLKRKKKFELAQELAQFYRKIKDSAVIFINQPEPRGFGDAVYTVRSFTGQEAFLVHAGDDLIVSKNNNHLIRLVDAYKRYNADVAFFVEKIKDPTKYGVIVGNKVGHNIYKVDKVVEKPLIPPSNLAIIAIYIFSPMIFQAIKKTQPDENDEIQLTDALQQLVEQKSNIYAIELNKDEKRIDIGTPESYWKALKTTYNLKQIFN